MFQLNTIVYSNKVCLYIFVVLGILKICINLIVNTHVWSRALSSCKWMLMHFVSFCHKILEIARAGPKLRAPYQTRGHIRFQKTISHCIFPIVLSNRIYSSFEIFKNLFVIKNHTNTKQLEKCKILCASTCHIKLHIFDVETNMQVTTYRNF